ncbi:hypothetical protein [Leucobacter sp. G161]|uniref:hypothetical protein n=1 Tax=Leucobacter sp. G161 TaxID=663704 RepID=UPI00073C7E15|nr:hypothetical protein [Leucobacter sp. G161]KUF06925.1 hypothetical protein AUL38_10630 [Leucobacter sp. G161]
MSVARELHNIRHMPYGTARTAAAEAAARKVEADGPREHLAEALLDLVEAYTFGGEGQKSFVVFARTLRLWDESPELFDESDEHNLFWEFKWIASDLPDYPQITREQAEAFLDDMQRRFELQGSGVSAVLAARFGWAWQSGATGAEAARLTWITSPRDDFDDCHACVIGRQTDFLTEQGRFAEAFELGQKQDGNCNIEPAKTFHATALAALHVGQPADALKYHQLAVASETRGNRDLASSRGQSFELLARGGQLERALRELRGDYRELLTDPPSPMQHLRFLLGLIAGLSANRDRGEGATGVSLPEAAGAGAADATVAELHAWATSRAREYAAAFDGRSGTSYYSDLVERALAAQRSADELPVETGSQLPALVAEASADEPAPMNAAAPKTASGATTPGAPSGIARLWAKLTDRSGAASSAAESSADADADAAAARPEPPLSPEGLLSRAEESLARKDYAAAARDYEAAVPGFEAGGWLERAGLAAAEAAQCAALDRREERAHANFGVAVPLLRSGGADAGTLAAVLAAWAPVASRMNDVDTQIRATAAALDGHPEFDPAGLSDDLAERRRQEWATERATLRDTLARSLGATRGRSFGEGLDGDRAATESLLAGEEFAQLGLLADASHAFWLAGMIQRDRGDTEAAVWGLESAFEGFTAAKQRKDRLLVAGELIELLKQTGQSERAAAIVEQL